jgi:4-hydroxybenzoate polyprenyltransferase
LVVPLSIAVNSVAPLAWQTYLYLFLFAIQSHLIGEVMDIEPDQKAGRKTTATVLGLVKTKWLITLIVAGETLLLMVVFNEYVFGGMLGLGVIWLLLDVLVIYKDRMYTKSEMKLLAKSSNIIALASIAYVWYSGCLILPT